MTIGKILLASSGAALIALGLNPLTAASDPEEQGLPFADTPYVLGDDIVEYEAFMMSGGPPPDGIPAVDDPVFVDAAEARLDPGEMVIGYHHGGEARAYPQRILVHHEIVNDRVGDMNVAITYCPLTATAQGFERGGTTFGVSGQLLNSNLVLFDRETRSYFSQINATGLRGEYRGRTLVEVTLTWTTWERWKQAHPDTKVLSERTGHLRNYARDPYGTYNPVGGYYAQDRTIFPLMHSSERHHQKEMVVGGRTTERSAYFVLSELARERVQVTENFVAVYDSALDAGYIYALEGRKADIVPADGMYDIEGRLYPADALPLERVVPVEAFFFAWHAFYPDSEHV